MADETVVSSPTARRPHRERARGAARALAGALAWAAGVACGDDPTRPGAATELRIADDPVIRVAALDAGTVLLATAYDPATGMSRASGPVAWTSLTPGVAEVRPFGERQGVVWPRAVGVARIVATSGRLADTLEVDVVPPIAGTWRWDSLATDGRVAATHLLTLSAPRPLEEGPYMQWIGEYRRERIEHCGEATCVGSATFEYDYRLVGAQLTLEEPNVPCCGGPPLPPLRGGSARVGAGGIALRSDESSAAFDRLHTRVP